MRSSILFAFIAYVMLGFMQLASATPVAPTKDVILERDITFYDVLINLEASTTSCVEQINTFIDAKTVTKDNLEPCIKEITAALKIAYSELTTPKSSSSLRQRVGLLDPRTAALASELILTFIQLVVDIVGNGPILNVLLPPLLSLLLLALMPLLFIFSDPKLDAKTFNEFAQIFQKVSPGVSLKSLGF